MRERREREVVTLVMRRRERGDIIERAIKMIYQKCELGMSCAHERGRQ